MHRAKVLSSGAVRGHGRSLAADRVRFASGFAVPGDFFRSGVLRGPGGAEAAILGSESVSGVLALAGPFPELAAETPLEVVFAEEAAVLAARLVTGTPAGRPLPELAMRLATTRGTNALLERRGAPVALFITAGFGDLLAIGNQQRPDLFALAVEPRRPLYRTAIEVDERLAADGSVLRPLSAAALEAAARRCLEEGVDCAAVAFLHGYRNPVHERAAAAVLAHLGFRHVSVSADLAPRIQILPRAETAVVNAYLSRALESYLGGVQRALGRGTLHVMTSSGGLVGAARYPPKESLLSGPAGGVVGAASAGAASGESRLVGFDMGGTSTDVSRFGGRLDYRRTTSVGGARLATPSLAIETVAAGGGSVCWFDGTQVRVGPESAGAAPGPACYGGGGPLTLTDVNLLLGRVVAGRFVIPLHPAAAERAADELLAAVRRAGDEALSRESLLTGLLAIANERMAEAIRRISTRRGYGLGDHVLVAFGGAGGQHACALAALLGMRSVLVPVDAGILSALGLRAARLERFAERSVLAPLEEVEPRLGGWFESLAAEAVGLVEAEGVERPAIEVGRRSAELRVAGQEATLTVDWPAAEGLAAAFAARYRSLYGYDPPPAAVEVESLRLVAGTAAEPLPGRPPAAAARAAEPAGSQPAWSGKEWSDWPVYERGALAAGDGFAGPGLVVEEYSVTVVDAGWTCRVDGAGALALAAAKGGR
ncbi:MAG: hydantoinase/oxoprolinase family protein [Acidobacteriota bacterium]|nr:hydantoinase/oxoprolinase family protein [Acidobacteriota bacterium]